MRQGLHIILAWVGCFKVNHSTLWSKRYMVPIIQDNAKRIIPVVCVVINSHTIGLKLIRINKRMSHVTAEIKAFIDNQNICLSGDWVDVLGCDCCNRNVRDDIKGVVEPFYFTMLASKFYQSEILTRTTCVSVGIKFTICNREWEHY